MPNRSISKIKTGNKNIAVDKFTPFIRVKTNTTIKLKKRFIEADIELDIIIIYFGKFIFRINPPRLTMDFKPPLVISAKKFHNTIPRSIDTGQCGMPAPIFKK